MNQHKSRKSIQKKQNITSQASFSKSQIIFDPETHQRYKKGAKLGGGGFGEVFEFIDIDTNKIYAGKIIPIKKIEKDPQSNAAFNNENKFNNNLNFEYLCKCQSTFKDNQNAYFILDYYPNKTLNDLIQVRQTLSEFEVKHYGYQLLLAIEYLHNHNIIHRDLKLSNILLSEKMEVRLCDFGLAIENGGDGQQTTCGTPNYISPEVLIRKNNNSYSFEVDIWSFGVVLYTLLFHKTPFEDEGIGKTKYNIINIIYDFPNNIDVSNDAKDIIMKILVKEPYLRPKIDEIKSHPFFNYGKGIPKYLPSSTLHNPLNEREIANLIENAIIHDECLDKPFANEISKNGIYGNYDLGNRLNFNSNLKNNYNDKNVSESDENEENLSENDNGSNNSKTKNQNIKSENDNDFNNSKYTSNSFSSKDNDSNEEKQEKINKVAITTQKSGKEEKINKNNETGGFLGSKSPFDSHLNLEDKENKNIIIVEKFIDCSDKYGIGYLLSNDDVGAFFNDGTKMILIKCTNNIIYINKNNEQHIINFKGNVYKSELEGKRRIFKLFYKLLIKNLKNKESFDLNPLLDKKSLSGYVIKWIKTQYASFFLLSSKLIQVFFNDKTEILFLLQDKCIQYIDKNKKKHKEKFDNTQPIKYKNEEMNKRVIYAINIIIKK